MITGLAHVAVCVPDCEAAVGWYESVLGMTVLSPPLVMSGAQLREDMGELVADPTMKAAIVGFPEAGDHVIEVIEYPEAAGRPRPAGASITDVGLTHLGLVCDDVERTRAELERRGVRFLTTGIARVAGLRTTWFMAPFGLVCILVEKSSPDRPYYRQVP